MSTTRSNSDILKSRAAELARESDMRPGEGPFLELLEFGLGRERYAIEARHVREIARVRDVTPVPGVPKFILGVMNIRGQILSVIDLRQFLNVSNAGIGDSRSKAIVVAGDGIEFAIIADAIEGITRLGESSVHPPPPTLNGIHTEYLKGIASDFLIILDGEKLLTASRLIVDEEA
jgi:purine-binding chemotaxis protein CheW